MGFVMECISTVTCSNLLNKGLQSLFVAKGYCLFVFTLCKRGFNLMKKRITSIRGPRLAHLFFCR